LFGSHARDEAGPDSDVDLAILFTDEPVSTLDGPATRIAADLERELSRPADVVVLNRAPADLVHRVLRDGILVCENDPSLRIRFEVAKRNEYFDLLPMLRRYRGTQDA
jgi:predicted nucleotidyltransferase